MPFYLHQREGEEGMPQKSQETWKKAGNLKRIKIPEKGKPPERVGRKAMGPTACEGYGSPVASILRNSIERRSK